MDSIIGILGKTDIGQLIAIVIIGWFFYSRLTNKMDQKIDRLEANLNLKIDKLSEKVDDVDKRVNDVDKRLIAVETLLRMKECCMINDERQLKKVE